MAKAVHAKGSEGGGTRVGTCTSHLAQLQRRDVEVGNAAPCCGAGQPRATLILPNNTKANEPPQFFEPWADS
jgi:hypothetical protein